MKKRRREANNAYIGHAQQKLVTPCMLGRWLQSKKCSMKKAIQIILIITLGTITYVLLGASCLPKKKDIQSARGHFLGQEINVTVDHYLAKAMIENPQSKSVKGLFSHFETDDLKTSVLSEISKKYSKDVATFYFLQRLYENRGNKYCQDLYHQTVLEDKVDIYTALKKYHIVFVPGLGYKEDTTTGADFAHQRKLLKQYEISNELIETEEWGLSDANAQIIAYQLKSINDNHDNILVVSASKGGLETAIALGKILEPNEIKNIKSWISVGGILRGSPIADNYLKAPKCWFAEFMLWTKGKKIDIVKDLSYEMRKAEFEKLKIPDQINVIHYVGAPLATNISKEIKSRYCSMNAFGPNDGLTPLADEITANGFVVSELGLDHYYRDDQIDKKTMALAYVAVNIEEKGIKK